MRHEGSTKRKEVAKIGIGEKSKAEAAKAILFLSWERKRTLNERLPRHKGNPGKNQEQRRPATSVATQPTMGSKLYLPRALLSFVHAGSNPGISTTSPPVIPTSDPPIRHSLHLLSKLPTSLAHDAATSRTQHPSPRSNPHLHEPQTPSDYIH